MNYKVNCLLKKLQNLFLFQYVKIFNPVLDTGSQSQKIDFERKASRLRGNKLKVVIALGLTSYHTEQRS